MEECIKEMKCFVRGGRPGIARLLEVHKSIFIHYEIDTRDDAYSVVNSLGLKQELQDRMLLDWL